jgi:hypothetical protein
VAEAFLVADLAVFQRFALLMGREDNFAYSINASAR